MTSPANTPPRPPLAGPRKLICIHSGTCDYAEVDISAPVQLVAANNVGKTALISTLQFLYIDDARYLDFGSHKLPASREFYFNKPTSYILFECDTPVTGIITICLRSAGPSTNYEIERYWYRGPYQREDFIDSETNAPRSFDQIRPRLSDREFSKISGNDEYRGLLGAVDHRTPKTWGLVAMEDAKRYRNFTKTFQRLLQLKDLGQDQLKDVLADCANIRQQDREIDLAKTATAQLSKIELDRNEIETLQNTAGEIREARALQQRELQSRALAHHLTKLLRERCAAWNEEYDRRIRDLNTAADAENLRLAELKKEKASLDQQKDQHQQALGQINLQLEAIEGGRKHYADYQAELKAAEVQNLKNAWLAINARVQNLPAKTVEQLKAGQTEKTDTIKRIIRQIEDHRNLLATWLREHMRDDEVNALGAIFNHDILQSVVDDHVQIHDAKQLLAMLRQITERCDAREYDDSRTISFDFPSGALGKAAKIGRIETLETQLETLRGELKEIEKDLDTRLRYTALQEELAQKQEAYDSANADHNDYLAWKKELQQEARLREEKQTHETQVTELRGKLEKNERAREEAKRQKEIFAENARLLAKANDHINTQIQKGLPSPDGDNPGIDPDPIPQLPDELRDWFIPVQRACETHRSESALLSQKMSVLDSRFAAASFPYDTSASVTARLDQLDHEIEALDERRRNLDNEWMALLRTSRSSFALILDSLNALHRKCRELNKQFAALNFSSIRKVELILHEHDNEVSIYKRYGKDDGEPSLFDTPADANRQLDILKTELQNRPKLQLSQLYGLQFEITRNDGKKNPYTNFDQIESTGTTVVLKVILNLIVLNDLRIAEKSRIPFYLDEIAELDPHNLSNILTLSEQLGFVGIFAAPEAAIGLRNYVYMVPNAKSRLIVDERHRQTVLRDPSEPDAEADGTSED